MENLTLKDGSTTMMFNHRDLVDIVRDGCGDDVAAQVEKLDPSDWENIYNAYDKLLNLIVQVESGIVTIDSENTALLENIADMMADVL